MDKTFTAMDIPVLRATKGTYDMYKIKLLDHRNIFSQRYHQYLSDRNHIFKVHASSSSS